MKLKRPSSDWSRAPSRADSPTSSTKNSYSPNALHAHIPPHLRLGRPAPPKSSAPSQNGSSIPARKMPHPPWEKPYPPDKPRRGPGDPVSDLLPPKGSAARELADAQISSLVRLVGEGRLPNFRHALIHPNKIWGFALRTDHDQGKSKANLFSSMGFIVLSMAERDFARKDWRDSGKLLISQIRRGISLNPILEARPDAYGVQLTVFLPIEGPNGRREELRTVWQYGFKVAEGAGFLSSRPWLTSIYKDAKRKRKLVTKKGLPQ